MVSEFERKAWENRGDADKHSPSLALKIVLDDIERKKINPRHVYIVVVEDVGHGDLVSGYQAGDLSELAVEGALARAIRMAADNRRDG